MRAFAHDLHTYPLPLGHRFPLAKYRLVREAAAADPSISVEPAPRASRSELELAHEPAYLARVEAGAPSRQEELALGLPWSPALVERGRRSVGATLEAAEAALADGVAANLGGGTHHAFPDQGRGFCVFNDVVVASRSLRAARRIERALVVDLDVHQGDGTHTAFSDERSAFTFSVNGFGNYPFQRVAGDLELDLPDGSGDGHYLDGLAPPSAHGARALAARPLLLPRRGRSYAGDRLGRLALTKDGLATRDRLVRDALSAAGVPVCVTLAGGYADPIEDTVEINVQTLRIFARNER